ncbi:Ger(x)C family spore germination protein [Viridibacillus sp. FSL H8-0110]|uniref:Ger(x)C family spore germination protein n=1 Tax=Viridibacillus sp. FSL H8-0110 TaxID=2921376 RepID=UPI0030F6F870
MNKRIWIIVLLLSTFLSGCWDVDEPERMLYVHGVGVDFKDGEYEVYTQIIDFSNTAKTEQPTNNPVQSEVGYAKGKTIDEAIFKLYHSIDQKVFWGFFTFIIFSEEALKDGRANPIIDNFLRYRETRYQIWMYGTNDPIKDLLLTTPIINKSLILSKLGDPENSYEQESFIKPINFRELIIGLNEPNHEMAIPFISVNKHWETEQNETNTISLSGVGLLSPKEFKGYLPADKIRGLQWMTKETKRGEVTVQLDSNDSVEFTVVVDKLKLKVKPIVRKNDVKFDIAIKMNVTVSEFHGDLSSNEIRREVIKEVEKEIRGTYEEALNHNTDIYRLSEYLYRKEFKAWKKLQKDGKVELTEHSIQNIKVEIRKLKSQRKSSKETIEK